MECEYQYKKWQWITIDIEKNKGDFRIESYKPIDLEAEIELGEVIKTDNCWAKRKEYALNKVWTNMTELIKVAKERKISLAVVKPTKVLDFIWENDSRDWDKKKLATIKAKQQQLDLFKPHEIFEVAKKLPYKFSYIFETEDGEKRTVMIEDWELGMLYWNSLKCANGDEKIACEKVKQKYFVSMLKDTDFYFFMGTTKQWHNVSPNPFVIIGTFYPKKDDKKQLSLF